MKYPHARWDLYSTIEYIASATEYEAEILCDCINDLPECGLTGVEASAIVGEVLYDEVELEMLSQVVSQLSIFWAEHEDELAAGKCVAAEASLQRVAADLLAEMCHNGTVPDRAKPRCTATDQEWPRKR